METIPFEPKLRTSYAQDNMTRFSPKRPVTLASGSKTRADMFARAGLNISVSPAPIDEAAVKAAMLAEDAKPHDIVDTLAEMKAARVASKTEGFVIGADQILVCDNQIFDKVSTKEAALEKLQKLQGKSHTLMSAAVIFEDGKTVWRKIGRAQLIMRPMMDVEIENYLEAEGDAIFASVGCYFIEGRGANLFTRVQGDYFSVLGMPLLDILGYLRDRSVI